MPCMDGGPSVHEVEREMREVSKMLCSVMRQIEAQKLDKPGRLAAGGKPKPFIQMSPELATWWKTHKRFDKEREDREKELSRIEQLRAKARSKLTKLELKALGLED